MLLDRSGELLTREEISRELWPDGTFVDYAHGVNSAVNRIREALGDTASNPRFVETLARRGYRFVAPVERIVLNEDPSPAVPEPVSEPAAFVPVQIPQPAVATVPAPQFLDGILASPEELPKASYPLVQTLFVLMQCMYVGFYIGALANLAEIEDLFSALPRATELLILLIVTVAILRSRFEPSYFRLSSSTRREHGTNSSGSGRSCCRSICCGLCRRSCCCIT